MDEADWNRHSKRYTVGHIHSSKLSDLSHLTGIGCSKYRPRNWGVWKFQRLFERYIHWRLDPFESLQVSDFLTVLKWFQFLTLRKKWTKGTYSSCDFSRLSQEWRLKAKRYWRCSVPISAPSFQSRPSCIVLIDSVRSQASHQDATKQNNLHRVIAWTWLHGEEIVGTATLRWTMYHGNRLFYWGALCKAFGPASSITILIIGYSSVGVSTYGATKTGQMPSLQSWAIWVHGFPIVFHRSSIYISSTALFCWWYPVMDIGSRYLP